MGKGLEACFDRTEGPPLARSLDPDLTIITMSALAGLACAGMSGGFCTTLPYHQSGNESEFFARGVPYSPLVPAEAGTQGRHSQRLLELRAPFRPELRLHFRRAVDLAGLGHAIHQLAGARRAGWRGGAGRRRHWGRSRLGHLRSGLFARGSRRPFRCILLKPVRRRTSGKAKEEHCIDQSFHYILLASASGAADRSG